MQQRIVSIWFKYLKTDWHVRRNASLGQLAFVLYKKSHGRMIICAANAEATKLGIQVGSVLADARAVAPNLQAVEETPEVFEKALQGLAAWCIRYSPIVATDGPDGLIIDATGCAHLWGDEEKYLQHLCARIHTLGYTVSAAMAGTIGCAWAFARFSSNQRIIQNGDEESALQNFPPQALRLDPLLVDRLLRLGLKQINLILKMPTSSLRRRFGSEFVLKLQQTLGYAREWLQPITITPEYVERLNCFDAIVTRNGIEIALQQLLTQLCARLCSEGKGLRKAVFSTYRVDGRKQQLEICTNSPVNNTTHLFRLFELTLGTIVPDLGIELFVLEAPIVEEKPVAQKKLFTTSGSLTDQAVAQLLDRLANKIGQHNIRRYLPDEHYLPEHAIRKATTLNEQPTGNWAHCSTRPLRILCPPELITVTAPIPDYPPMNFRHQGNLHKIVKADGPERIEQEWWRQEGLLRDYYYVEDEKGCRYWLFRSGHYDDSQPVQWYLHGYCA